MSELPTHLVKKLEQLERSVDVQLAVLDRVLSGKSGVDWMLWSQEVWGT